MPNGLIAVWSVCSLAQLVEAGAAGSRQEGPSRLLCLHKDVHLCAGACVCAWVCAEGAGLGAKRGSKELGHCPEGQRQVAVLLQKLCGRVCLGMLTWRVVCGLDLGVVGAPGVSERGSH